MAFERQLIGWIFLAGLSVGWLVGLSESPVVAGVITTLLAFVLSLHGLLLVLPDGDSVRAKADSTSGSLTEKLISPAVALSRGVTSTSKTISGAGANSESGANQRDENKEFEAESSEAASNESEEQTGGQGPGEVDGSDTPDQRKNIFKTSVQMRNDRRSALVVIPAAVMVIGVAVGSTIGLVARSHSWFVPSPSASSDITDPTGSAPTPLGLKSSIPGSELKKWELAKDDELYGLMRASESEVVAEFAVIFREHPQCLRAVVTHLLTSSD